MPEMRVMESRLAIVPTLPFCGLPNVNRVGDRECYAVIQQPDIPTNRLVYPVPFNTIFPSAVP